MLGRPLAAGSDLGCLMDADASLDPLDLHLVAGPVERGEADLAMGRRRPARGAWPVHARIANRDLAHAVGWRTGLRLRDLGPMRATRRDALLALGITDCRFGWPLEMVLRADGAGWRVVEVDVPYRSLEGDGDHRGHDEERERHASSPRRPAVSTPGPGPTEPATR